MFEKLISGSQSNKIYFKELLKDKTFRNKVINFYNSEKVKKFIDERCNNSEKEKLKEKLPYLLNLMKSNIFWERIMLFPLSKHKMASVENYLRIVINTEYVKYYNTQEFQKKSIINLLLFELLIHEIFHFLRRLIFLGKKAKDAITPPSSYNKDNENEEKDNNKEKEENLSLNEENNYGEIGQRLIRYIFNVNKIIDISYKAGTIFENYTLKEEKEIEKLKTILMKEDSSHAKFSFTGISGISHKLHDCRHYFSNKDYDYD